MFAPQLLTVPKYAALLGCAGFQPGLKSGKSGFIAQGVGFEVAAYFLFLSWREWRNESGDGNPEATESLVG